MDFQVDRTFSPFLEEEETENDFDYWFHFTSEGHYGTPWSQLLKKRLVVIVGEAGIGKTFEFKKEVRTLSDEGNFAFFLPLNVIIDSESFNRALFSQNKQYEKWLRTNEPAYIFLDSVDEARLISPPTLKNALAIVQQALFTRFKNISFFVSSRITDWCLPDVQNAIKEHLLQSMISAESGNIQSTLPSGTDLIEIERQTVDVNIELEVFKLDPLSTENAKKLAEGFGVSPIEPFWQHVEDGEYRFLASRPLDLKWLTARWKQKHKLGIYSELLEAGVNEWITEKNPSYVSLGAVLSLTQLREGAEQLAAACVFSGYSYIQVGAEGSLSGTINAAEVLPHWNGLEHLRLLNSAIFDEATFGRIKFHHRSVREYLAACWVEREISAGLPVNKALALFIQSPYGQRVLLNSRRSVLCWLATLNAKVRQYMIQRFPEMLMFEGDPQRWSQDDVIEAFEGYIKKLGTGFRPNWSNYESENKRVARMLPPKLIADHLRAHTDKPEVLTELLTLVRDGRVEECAEDVFSIYKDDTFPDRVRHLALITLSSVATTAHKAMISDDLLSGKLKDNHLIAAGLEVVGIETLDERQLSGIFLNTTAESEFGGGPMASSISDHLLLDLSLDGTLSLLSGLLAAFRTENLNTLIDRKDGEALREAWLLSVLPNVIIRALQLISPYEERISPVLMDALLVVEKTTDTRLANDEDIKLLKGEIDNHKKLRRDLALNIALSKDINHAVIALTGMPGLVHLAKEDLEWLLQESLRKDIEKKEGQIWYEVAKDIALNELRGVQRKDVFQALAQGLDAEVRKTDIKKLKNQRIIGLIRNRGWKHEDRVRHKEKILQLETSKSELLKDLEGIRSGDSLNGIQWLINYSWHHKKTNHSKVNVAPVYRDFGQEIGDAFSEGMAKIWRKIEIPDPANYLDNRVPWAGLIGLASMNHAFANGFAINSLSPDEVERVAKLSIWGYGKPEPWFNQLIESYSAQVLEALKAWFELELKLAEDVPILHTVELLFNSPIALKAAFLNLTLDLFRNRKIVRQSVKRRILRELIAESGDVNALIGELASSNLLDGLTTDPSKFAVEWFADWASIDFSAAWSWFEKNSISYSIDPTRLKLFVGEVLEDTAWAKHLSGTSNECKALISLFRYLDEPIASVRTVRGQIPGILASLQGKYAQEALQILANENRGSLVGGWILNKANEHASTEAERRGQMMPDDLLHFGDVYTRDPKTEGELFEQVLARLEEIRENLEGGPFSDRILFAPGMEEKYLQIWLAARLDDTPRRRFIPRFKVSREPQVDEEKRTDIEVSCAAGKVCIEIKPLDNSRKYSAKSLGDTLRDQLVGQYLKGKNSKHGVLVLMRLDNKMWMLPGVSQKKGFGDLLDYLKSQASQIKAFNNEVERLEVFGINCL